MRTPSGPGQLPILAAYYVQAVEGSLLCSKISQAEPSVDVAFLMWTDMEESVSGESDNLLQRSSLF